MERAGESHSYGETKDAAGPQVIIYAWKWKTRKLHEVIRVKKWKKRFKKLLMLRSGGRQWEAHGNIEDLSFSQRYYIGLSQNTPIINDVQRIPKLQ